MKKLKIHAYSLASHWPDPGTTELYIYMYIFYILHLNIWSSSSETFTSVFDSIYFVSVPLQYTFFLRWQAAQNLRKLFSFSASPLGEFCKPPSWQEVTSEVGHFSKYTVCFTLLVRWRSGDKQLGVEAAGGALICPIGKYVGRSEALKHKTKQDRALSSEDAQ